jgi:hypothetical protein
LLATAERLKSIASLPQSPVFIIKQPQNYTSSIDISAQDVMSGAKTALATVTIQWQSNPWDVSTGIMFSTLDNRTFSNVALFDNGVPQLDSEGKNLTIVEESVKRPTILFPVVMLHYKIPGFPALMASGGIGLNLGTTTAEFVVGPSIKIFGIVVTGAAHFGRTTELTEGVQPGDKLGSSPPALPTDSHWVKTPAFGLAVSYVVPLS